MIIYCVENIVNGKRYIGQTKNSLKQRWRVHCLKGYALYHSIQKYGKENFKIYEIEKCNNIKHLNEREEIWIQELNTMSPNGYNLQDGGKRSKLSVESIEKIKRKNTGLKRSESFKKKISLYRTGKKHTQDAKNKISVKNKGRVFTKEHRQKLSESNKRAWKLRKNNAIV